VQLLPRFLINITELRLTHPRKSHLLPLIQFLGLPKRNKKLELGTIQWPEKREGACQERVLANLRIDELEKFFDQKRKNWPAPGSEDTELGVLMEPEVSHGETEVYAGVQA
jgi:hypothetical protein